MMKLLASVQSNVQTVLCSCIDRLDLNDTTSTGMCTHTHAHTHAHTHTQTHTHTHTRTHTHTHTHTHSMEIYIIDTVQVEGMLDIML